jgi:hypothetical protein
MRACVRRRLPRVVGHAGHVDEDVVGAEDALLRKFVEGGCHAEGRHHVQRDLQVELAPDLPHLLVALDIDLAAHDHAQKLVVGGEILLPDAARAAGMLLAFPPAFEIAEDAAAARVAQSLDGGVGMLG